MALCPSITNPSTGTFSTGTNPQAVADHNVFQWHIAFFAIFTDNARCFENKSHQSANRGSDMHAGAQLQDLPQQNYYDNHHRTVEIRFDRIPHRLKILKKNSQGDRRQDAIHIRGPHTQGDQYKHVGTNADPNQEPPKLALESVAIYSTT